MTTILIAGAVLAIPLLMLHAAQAELERAEQIAEARKHTAE